MLLWVSPIFDSNYLSGKTSNHVRVEIPSPANTLPLPGTLPWNVSLNALRSAIRSNTDPNPEADAPVKITLCNYVTNLSNYVGAELEITVYQALDNISKSLSGQGPSIGYVDVPQQYPKEITYMTRC